MYTIPLLALCTRPRAQQLTQNGKLVALAEKMSAIANRCLRTDGTSFAGQESRKHGFCTRHQTPPRCNGVRCNRESMRHGRPHAKRRARRRYALACLPPAVAGHRLLQPAGREALRPAWASAPSAAAETSVLANSYLSVCMPWFERFESACLRSRSWASLVIPVFYGKRGEPACLPVCLPVCVGIAS